jgi:hypothetical protein
MRNLISGIAVAFALSSATGLTSCSSEKNRDDGAQKAPIAEEGRLRMALETTSSSGKVYRLRNAILPVQALDAGPFPFDSETPLSPIGANAGDGVAFADSGVSPPLADADGGSGFPVFDDGGFGFAGSFGAGGAVGAGGKGSGFGGASSGGNPGGFPGASIVLNSEDDPSRNVLEAFLAPNLYQIQLLDGWFIEQVDELLGTSAFVDAQLLSSPFQIFEIQSDGETFVTFEFEVDGRRISFGDPGRLIVGINVHERQGGSCGNGFVDPGEECDSFDLNGQTCGSITMGALPFGFLQCTPFCSFDTTFCESGVGTGGFPGTGGAGTGGAPEPGDAAAPPPDAIAPPLDAIAPPDPTDPGKP